MKSKLKHNFIEFLDQIPLWWLEILVTIVFFLPYFVLGDGCVFEINDQLDESIMNYSFQQDICGMVAQYILRC